MICGVMCDATGYDEMRCDVVECYDLCYDMRPVMSRWVSCYVIFLFSFFLYAIFFYFHFFYTSFSFFIFHFYYSIFAFCSILFLFFYRWINRFLKYNKKIK